MDSAGNGGAMGSAFSISESGMDAQSARLRVIAENLANQDSTGSTPGADPYRRKTVTFHEVVGEDGMSGVGVDNVGQDMSEFTNHYDPSNPAANTAGYVKLPNVNSFVELMDMREAERSYAADLKTMQAARTMFARTLDILK